MKRKRRTLGNFRSEFEQNINEILKQGNFSYESEKIQYHIPRTYTPDFIHASGVYVEAKGFFREGDTQKYKAIRDCLPADRELVFVLMKPEQKVRRGTKLTMASWCEKEGIKWYCMDTLGELVDYVNS